MNPARKRILRPSVPWLLCATAFAVAFGYALYTRHVWEDFYITYRSSKNLATGFGLVFNHGDRLHTFTSPLGVLLPSLAFLLTGNSSDEAALWIFRGMSCAAFGGAVYLMHSMLVRQISGFMGRADAEEAGLAPFALSLVPVAWVIFDAKSVDFSINGMETAFMLLFLAFSMASLFGGGSRRWLPLGLSWAGLMWTRPDSFVYIGLLAIGLWLFNDARITGQNRKEWLVTYFRAGLLCSALYLPWLVAATLYYGSPVPFTIIAKSASAGGAKTFLGLCLTAKAILLHGGGTLGATFLPAYSEFGGWPVWPALAFKWLGLFCAVLWILPRLGMAARVASFAFFGTQVYLSYYPNYPYPWYLPPSFFLGAVSLGLAGAQWFAWLQIRKEAWSRSLRLGLVGVLLLPVSLGAWYLCATAGQMREQQRLIETGTRRAIGEWLATHAKPDDRVFLEPLGYIGFFSGLKTYDFPGLSSSEVVAARRRLGDDWGNIVDALHPEWLVLRPKEIARFQVSKPDLLVKAYMPVITFSVIGRVESLHIHGRPYLEHDAEFVVFRRVDRP